MELTDSLIAIIISTIRQLSWAAGRIMSFIESE